MIDFETLPMWIEPNMDDTYQSDDLERPPLIGNSKIEWNNLFDIPWNQLEDAYGKADEVPYYLLGLVSDNNHDQVYGSYGMYSAVTHQGSVYTASKACIPFLVDMLKLDDESSDLAMNILTRIAIGESHFIYNPRDVEHAKSIYFKDVYKYHQAILDYYNRTSNNEALRLLCFVNDNSLTLDLSLKTTADTEYENYASQSFRLIAQGFVIAQKILLQPGIPKENISYIKHIDEVKEYMYYSPSLLVRGSAAICLLYSGVKNSDALDLVNYLAKQNYNNCWSWDWSFSLLCQSAWLFSVDNDKLLKCDTFVSNIVTFEDSSGETKNLHTDNSSLIEMAYRFFPLENSYYFYLPEELNENQILALKNILKYSQNNILSYPINMTNVPTNKRAIARLLNQEDEELCKLYKGKPIWYYLQQLLMNGDKDKYNHLFDDVNKEKLLEEVFTPLILNSYKEECTLYIPIHDANIKEERISDLMSFFANEMKNEKDYFTHLLDKWLLEIDTFSDYDLAFKTPAKKIGIALLSITRYSVLQEKYYSLVRPYHKFSRFSTLPIEILREVIEALPKNVQDRIYMQYNDLNEEK